MIEWNNDGKVDVEDWMLIGMILDEDEQSEKRVGGGCLTSLALFIGIPLVVILMGQHFL